jgi:hypothetical protein
MDRVSTRLCRVSIEANAQLETAVLFLIFNRPSTTRDVFETIRGARPRRLYVAADGPRLDADGESERCADARRIASAIDWPCQLRTRLQDKNMGLATHVSSALDWFFDNEMEGIILEDDCIPHPSFYRFCMELLAHYREDPKIMHVAGNNLQYGRRRGRASYYFSMYPNVWGWASWRRAWKHYDFSLRPSWKLDNTWDTQWQLSIEKSHGLAIVPNVNLVQNIGFGPGATHTKDRERPAALEAAEMAFPLTHPAAMAPDRAADLFTYYAHHRMVRHLRLIWMYRIADFVYAKLKSGKRRLLRRR